MKKFVIVCLALSVVISMVGSASAVEPRKAVSNSTLASMGLGGMKAMSDQDGAQVRGKFKSFTLSWGSSNAQIGNFSQSSQNFVQLFKNFGGGGTFAIATHNNNIAIGGGFTIAGGF